MEGGRSRRFGETKRSRAWFHLAFCGCRAQWRASFPSRGIGAPQHRHCRLQAAVDGESLRRGHVSIVDTWILTLQPLICKDGATRYTSCKSPVTLIAQADNPGKQLRRRGNQLRGGTGSSSSRWLRANRSRLAGLSIHSTRRRVLPIALNSSSLRVHSRWGYPRHADARILGGPRQSVSVQASVRATPSCASCKRQADGRGGVVRWCAPNHGSRPMSHRWKSVELDGRGPMEGKDGRARKIMAHSTAPKTP
jgi:hypothetical protein